MLVRNMNVSQRSALGFGLIGLIVLLLGLFAILQMGKIRSEAAKLSDEWLPSIVALGDLNQHTLRTRIHTLRLIIDRTRVEENRATLARFRNELSSLEDAYQRTVDHPQERELFQNYQRARTAFDEVLSEIVRLEGQGRIEEAVEVVGSRLNTAGTGLNEAVARMTAFNNEQSALSAASAAAIFQSSQAWMIGTIVLAVLLTVVLAWIFTRSIVQPLQQAVSIAEVVASGDLTRHIDIVGRDEPARLLTALRSMQERLRGTIQSISHSSSQLASAAEQLNVVTEDSTRGMNQQSHEIEQAATAVNEMTAAVDEVARNAVATSEASRDSDATAQHGRNQVIRTVDSIGQLAGDVTQTSAEVERLAAQVRDISKVLDVIRSIAEQTNLLALNAAIEAARAGDAGRGFAVVADEVRALAHRTQQSTQEIEQMIGDVHQGTDRAVQAMQVSNERARTTLDLARAAGEALEEIAAAISQISERNLVIASASEEQAQVAREVDRNLVNIRDLSLQSSAGASQSSAASQELARLAVGLNGLVGGFRV
ncbi:methyl-accepting chemotaxis protein McpS [Pseudomonas sp. SCT]|uniref:Methyl-accepting chemotaxis protein n=2 Tax=Pseudomonadaceae TaxID=135621 RepID=L0GMJ9_STUST|nr:MULTISPECIES: methyl-accepting chemotaxis protein [Pseudomonadaceae]AGA87002.1 methyl-accepting chemotaxis protein [Stutzerimonas stutzeri RCH2]GCA55822.1 methyl-accepting chemotaxis protein McpS [Pseudomonas sp. SCT]